VGTGQNREREFFERAAALIMGNNRRERKLHTASRAIGQWSGNEGSSLVEFAVSVPVLLTFFFGLIQVSIASYTRAAISECAREGTRYAMVHRPAKPPEALPAPLRRLQLRAMFPPFPGRTSAAEA